MKIYTILFLIITFDKGKEQELYGVQFSSREVTKG
jgi:hypothetical protein